MAMVVKVECYSGFKADERPVRFVTPLPVGRAYEVHEVVEQWYGVGYQYFRFRADDGIFYLLRHDFEEDVWSLEAYRLGVGAGS